MEKVTKKIVVVSSAVAVGLLATQPVFAAATLQEVADGFDSAGIKSAFYSIGVSLMGIAAVGFGIRRVVGFIGR